MPTIDQITENYAKSIKPMPVRCSACLHALPVRAYTEAIDCSQFRKMKNAETLRDCPAYEPKP